MERSIDLNSDLGESVDGRTLGDDAAMFALVTSANIACGFHAGDALTMRTSCTLSVEHGVAIGAHVSYRDREGFGRRAVQIDTEPLAADVHEQLRALAAAAEQAGTSIRYVKPHGALYNRIAIDRAQADAVSAAVRGFDPALPLLGLAGTAIEASAAAHGLTFRAEAFVDRAYRPDGTLVARGKAGAVLTDVPAIAERAVRMVTDGDVVDVSGAALRVRVDSLCVHGDTPGAVAMARAVREALAAAGIRLAPFTAAGWQGTEAGRQPTAPEPRPQ